MHTVKCTVHKSKFTVLVLLSFMYKFDIEFKMKMYSISFYILHFVKNKTRMFVLLNCWFEMFLFVKL